MVSDFFSQSSLLEYSIIEFNQPVISNLKDFFFFERDTISWYNTFGIAFHNQFKEIIQQNNLDEFLIKLMEEETIVNNRVIESEKCVFVNVSILKTDGVELDDERIMFISGQGFVWSIQEKEGDYFDWIRKRLRDNEGIIRRKNADYLLYVLLESILENYRSTYKNFGSFEESLLNVDSFKGTPEFMAIIEKRKQELSRFKRATRSLRDVMIKLEQLEVDGMSGNYFTELKEQTANLVSEIDFEMLELESSINMIFSLQGHRLNEVMKTLTIISVIFIPLTFIAGIYGMNFKNMPELETNSGYFIILGLMCLVTILSTWYFSKKKWF